MLVCSENTKEISGSLCRLFFY